MCVIKVVFIAIFTYRHVYFSSEIRDLDLSDEICYYYYGDCCGDDYFDAHYACDGVSYGVCPNLGVILS